MQISIVGCGWLGLPLATLLAKNNTVKGSVTTPAKLELLEAKGIQPFLVDLNDPDAGVVTQFLAGSELLIIAIPPKIKSEGTVSYPQKIEKLLPFIKAAGIKKVLFTSSISVYAEDESIPVIDETTTPNPETESGKQVLAAEQVLQQCPDFETTILRLGGLMGGERHPVYHLAGKTGLQNPDGPVNLVSLDVVIAVILKVPEQEVWGETFVVVEQQHPSRKAFYTAEANKRNLPLPQFDASQPSKGKLLLGHEKIFSLLGYRL